MAEIYKNATITIAAASSPDVKCGFLEDRQIPVIPLPLTLPKGGFGTLWAPKGYLTAPDEPLDRRLCKGGCCHQKSYITLQGFDLEVPT
jgi:hypothetical protein